MKKNLGSADRMIRTLLAVLVTSAVSFCPLYVPFKLSTLKRPDTK
jgi:hypothetical protein